jgi:hypothetical protein
MSPFHSGLDARSTVAAGFLPAAKLRERSFLSPRDQDV